MRSMSAKNLAPNIFEVESIKEVDGKVIKDKYTVDLSGPYCQCKAFFMKKPCPHIPAVIQLLRVKGNVVKFNKKEKCHYVMGDVK